MAAAPAETDPRQVSKPAAARPGAKTLGTLRRPWVPVVLKLETVPPLTAELTVETGGFPLIVTFPPVAAEVDAAPVTDARELDLELETPTPMPVDCELCA
jgi:hypothetical protein